MLNVVLSLITAAAAAARIDLRTEPLFVSTAANGVLVRVADGYSTAIALCPLPPGAAPDLSFSDRTALASCVDDTERVPDQPGAVALFSDNFELVLAERLDAEPSRGRMLRDSLLIGLLGGSLISGLPLALAVHMGELRDLVTRVGAKRLFGLHAAFAAAIGGITAQRFFGEIVAHRQLRRDLTARIVGRSEPGPMLINADEGIFHFVRSCVREAMARTAAGLAQRESRGLRPIPVGAARRTRI